MSVPDVPTLSRGVSRASVRLLLPREHGAYGQLLFPMSIALVLGDRGAAALALTTACAAAFVGHEALLVLLGHRGARAARERRRASLAWLIGCSAVAAAAAVLGVVRAPGAAGAALLVPAGLGGVVLLFIARHREHTTAGEISAAVALSSCGLPIALAGGVALDRGITCWLVFASSFAVATVAVRSVIASVKSPQRPATDAAYSARDQEHVDPGVHPGSPGARLTGFGRGGPACWFAAGVIAFALVCAARGWTMWAAPLALVPVCGLAAGLALFPPHPRHLRAVGWSLVTATAAAAVVLVMMLA